MLKPLPAFGHFVRNHDAAADRGEPDEPQLSSPQFYLRRLWPYISLKPGKQPEQAAA
jgi:hypothetical protein